MRLKRLEIYGFKSFADRTVVVFDEGITGIVGPNGSGKSNLSDAVRWVLGEQSAKALRGGKMEDVIFNGTQKRKRMGYCEVSLVFENEDHALSVDYTEVMITRRVYRSGEGEYYINKSACRLKDIVELFRDTGVGKEGYSIIGQGRIDEILSQKSEDRRGVFEEAAGIVKYRTRKEESEKRLSNMRDNLSRVEDIIAELESQLEPLEKASETARRYLNLRDELRVLECSAFVLRSDRAKERIAEAEQLLTGLKEAIASEEKRADALSEQREKANEGAQKLENEVTAAHDAVLELTRETEAREGELGVLRAEINRILDESVGALMDAGHLESGSVIVLGCSTSEITGARIGKGSVPELGEIVAEAMLAACKGHGVHAAFQCCEHLNRGIVVEKAVLRELGLTQVRAIPQPKAGGSVPAAAWKKMEKPALAVSIQADAAIDIGDTLVGMHIRPVAVPLRISTSHVGHANLVMAYSRLPYIGGARAVYTE